MAASMFRHVATMIALWALLTQALLGSALPGTVLCIKGGEAICGPAPTSNECSCCCGETESPPSTVILVCTPCHEDCGDCVEVDLSDHPFAASAADRLPVEVSLGLAFHALNSISSAQTETAAALQGTGPPQARRHPDALIVASTILLL
jgi:hypothetical protein